MTIGRAIDIGTDLSMNDAAVGELFAAGVKHTDIVAPMLLNKTPMRCAVPFQGKVQTTDMTLMLIEAILRFQQERCYFQQGQQRHVAVAHPVIVNHFTGTATEIVQLAQLFTLLTNTPIQKATIL
jgi:hypothetical protein